jgi:putative transposase
MTDGPDKLAVSDPAWQKAVAREAIIRPLILATRISRGDVASACRQLGLKRTRLYELVAKFRRKPVTSSLLDEIPGPEKGRRLLSADQEDVVRLAIEAIFCALANVRPSARFTTRFSGTVTSRTCARRPGRQSKRGWTRATNGD